MPEYRVYMELVVSTSITVEAPNPEAAIDAAYESPGMPGAMSHSAFGGASVDEAGDWDAVLVTNPDGEEVWKEDSSR